MRTRIIHLINPKTDSLTTRPLYLNRALYSPLAGLLAVAAAIPRDRYEVVLTDENIESIDFDLKADLVGISAMTSYVNRGYEIADAFRARGSAGGDGRGAPELHAAGGAQALRRGGDRRGGARAPQAPRRSRAGADAGSYRADRLHPMEGLPMPRYDLLKKHRYVNRTFVQTSRGCHQGCTFCAEPLMNGLKFRYRPVDEVIREIENCGSRIISINDADFFGTPERPKEVMRALKGRGIQLAGGRHLEARAGRPHARAGRRQRLHLAEHRLRVDHALDADERAQAREPARDLRVAGREGPLLRHHGVRPVHVRLRRRRPLGVRADRAVQHRRRLRCLRLFGPHALSGHAHLVRDEEGRPHRLLRLDEVRPGQRRLSPGADVRRRAPARPDRGLRDVLLGVLHGRASRSAARAIARSGRSTICS